MTKHYTEDGFFTTSFMLTLKHSAKCVWFYCCHPQASQPHGIITNTVGEIALYLDLPPENVTKSLNALQAAGKIKWLRAENKIWVKEYILGQTMNPSYAIKLKNCLRKEPCELIWEYIKYYNDMGYWAAHNIYIDDIFSPLAPKSPKKDKEAHYIEMVNPA